MKSVKIFGKSVPLLTLVIISVLVVGASAGILTYFGRVTSQVTVQQSILLDNMAWTDSAVTDTLTGIGGNIITGNQHAITNRAELQIIADLDTVGGYDTDVITAAYPEYKLDALIDDDWVKFDLSGDVVWSAFTGITFDYLIDEGPNVWIPQVNLKLLNDVGELVYYASWVSPDPGDGVYGTIGVRATQTFDKGDFVIFDIATWNAIDQYDDLGTTMKAEIDLLHFDTFTQQAGCTVHDPNDNPVIHGTTTPDPCTRITTTSQQIVYVSNHAVGGGTITGVNIHPLTYGDALRVEGDEWLFDGHQWETIEFRMVYETVFNGVLDAESVVTNLVPIGLP